MDIRKIRVCWLAPWFIIRRFIAVRGVDRSASLAYVTLLSLVPMLATVAVLYRAFFSLHADRLVELITLLLPYSTGDIEENLSDFVSGASTISGIGSIIFLAIAFRLYLSIETTLNDVWCITARRAPAVRMFSFTMVVFWGPVVMGLGSMGMFWLGRQPWAPSSALLLDVGRHALPLLGLTMVYWLAPHTGVRIGSAAVGGLTATGGLYLLRKGFVAYLELFSDSDFNVIYGSLTLVIIFLVSLFAFWTLVIAGAVTSYVAQNLPGLIIEHDGGLRCEADPIHAALAMLTECFRLHLCGQPPPKLNQLEAALGITHPVAREAAEHLLATGLAAVTGRERACYVPGHDASTLTLADAMAKLGESGPPLLPGSGAPHERLGRHLKVAANNQRRTLRQVTFADLFVTERDPQPVHSDGETASDSDPVGSDAAQPEAGSEAPSDEA